MTEETKQPNNQTMKQKKTEKAKAEEVKPSLPSKPSEAKKEKTEIKVSAKLKNIIAEIEKLTVLELADLVKALEEKFGVAAVPAATPAATPTPVAPGQPGQAPAQAEEKAICNLVMTQSGANKIQVIKALRKIKPDLGLQDAKKLTEELPAEILKEAKKKDAEEAKKLLEEAGAKVELR